MLSESCPAAHEVRRWLPLNINTKKNHTTKEPFFVDCHYFAHRFVFCDRERSCSISVSCSTISRRARAKTPRIRNSLRSFLACRFVVPVVATQEAPKAVQE
uniref:(northern house mosquito) hypothetical protein n=1 Tax=Culex pipiens TaxID=7175 RepID=A0A8D8JP98_CULPI